MRKLISILIFACLLMQMNSRLLIIGAFYANRNYIATHLCINRDKPQMKCGGRCYLHRELKENDKKNEGNFLHAEKFLEVVFIISQKYRVFSLPFLYSKKDYPLMRVSYYHCSFVSGCFRPPAFI